MKCELSGKKKRYAIKAARLQIHANFHENFEMCLKVLFSEITKRKQLTHYQWHLQPT
jgi:hypothetical protein